MSMADRDGESRPCFFCMDDHGGNCKPLCR